MAGPGDRRKGSCLRAFSLDRSKGLKARAFHEFHPGDAAVIDGESFDTRNAYGVVEFGRKVRIHR